VDETVKIEVSGKISGTIARNLRDIAKAALEADTNLDLLRQAINGFSSGAAIKSATNDARTLRTEITRATQAQHAFDASNKSVANSLNVATTAAAKYGATLKTVNGASVGLVNTTQNLRGAFGGLAGMVGGVFAIRYYIEAQDALTGLQNKIRSLTPDYERQIDLERRLFDIANRTRTGVAAVTDGFVRYRKAMADASDTEVLRFTETLNKLLTSAGRTTSEVNSVVIQLGQALTSGRLQGDEFRALSENLPREALQAFADQLGVGVDELKKLGSEGLITTEVIRQAFASLATFADEQFNRTLPTIGQALEVLNNRFIEFTRSSSAGAQMLASAIMFIGDNLNIIIPLVATFAAMWAAVKIGLIVKDIIGLVTMIGSLGAAMVAANAPLVIAAGLLLAIGAAALAATGKLDEFISWVKNDLPTAIGGWIGQVGEAATATSGLSTAFDQVQTSAVASSSAMETGFTQARHSMDQAHLGIGMVVEDYGSLETATQSATQTITEYGPAASEAFNEGITGAEALTDALADTETQSNSVIDALQGIVSWAAQAISAVAGVVASAVNAVASAADDFFGADGSAPFQMGDKPAKIAGYRNGGSFKVGGTAGVDRNLVSFGATRGERVDVSTPTQQRREATLERLLAAAIGGNRGTNVVFNVQTPDANSFRRSSGQMASDFLASMRMA
jgi:tape measure domain-containing protein